MVITKKQTDKIKAAFRKHMTEYVNRNNRLPAGADFDSIDLPRCCAAQFLSCLGSPKSYFVHWLGKLHQKDPAQWPDPYRMEVSSFSELSVYAIAKALQMHAYLHRNSSRMFMSCIQASYQQDVGEALRKTGWKKAEGGNVRGNGTSMLTMWTKDARDWEVLTK